MKTDGLAIGRAEEDVERAVGDHPFTDLESLDDLYLARAAGADAGYLVVEIDPLFRDQRVAPQCLPGLVDIVMFANDKLPLAVIAEAACLDNNGKAERIPANTIAKPPSAELAPGQLDSDDLPPYEVLDEVLYQAIDGVRRISRPKSALRITATLPSLSITTERSQRLIANRPVAPR